MALKSIHPWSTAAKAIVALALTAGMMPAIAFATPTEDSRETNPNETVVSAKRIAGDYANETSVKISEAAFGANSCEWVVIARDDDFADAMSATGLAGALECPIILTDRYSLSKAAAEEIERLGATKAYIIGGTGAIKSQVDSDLADINISTTRVWGEASWDTSIECAKKIARHGGSSEDSIIAMSLNFQDALSISSFAYKYKVPIYLQTQEDERPLPNEAVDRIKETSGTIYVPGGPGAVKESTVEGVFGAERVVRIYGHNGYDTSNQIATYMVNEGLLTAETVTVACGGVDAKGLDALAGAALTGRAGGVMLLANENKAMEERNVTTLAGMDSEGTTAFLRGHDAEVGSVHVLGGTYVMPASLVDLLDSILAASRIAEGIVYAEHAIDLSSSTVQFSADGSVEISNTDGNRINAGDIVILPSAQEAPFGSALKVTDVSTSGDATTISGVKPKLEEAFASINISTDLYLESPTTQAVSPDGLSLPTVTDSIDIDLGNGNSISGSYSVSPDFHIEAIWIPGHEKYIELNSSTSFELDLGIEASTIPDEFQEIELASIPLYGEAGTETGVLLQPCIALDTSASGSVGLTADAVAHAQIDLYADSPLGFKASWENASPVFEIGGSAKAGIAFELVVSIFDYEMLGAGVEGGAKAEASETARTDLVCADVAAWVYAEAFAEALDDLDLGINYKKTLEIFNRENSPWKAGVHWENGSIVPKCTWGGSEAGGSGTQQHEVLESIQGWWATCGGWNSPYWAHIIGDTVYRYDSTGKNVWVFRLSMERFESPKNGSQTPCWAIYIGNQTFLLYDDDKEKLHSVWGDNWENGSGPSSYMRCDPGYEGHYGGPFEELLTNARLVESAGPNEIIFVEEGDEINVSGSVQRFKYQVNTTWWDAVAIEFDEKKIYALDGMNEMHVMDRIQIDLFDSLPQDGGSVTIKGKVAREHTWHHRTPIWLHQCALA